jgi:probable O-glycosylation ligase (exosortase A-associated)
MRDLVFMGFLAALFGVGLRRPFVFVLAYIYIDTVQPQRLMYTALNSLPMSLIAFIAAVGGWILADDKRGSRFGPRQAMLLVLLLYCWMTTINADFPIDAAAKWSWVWKSIVFAVFLPLTLKTRLRIESVILFMCLSASTIIIIGGIKTLASGGGYGVLNLMVTDNSGIYESSIISTVAIAIIPLILFLMKNGTVFPPEWRVKLFCLALCFACMLIPVGTEARTGLICIAVLAVLMLRQVKWPILWIAAAGFIAVASIPFLPESFTKRMDTIKEYKADNSASTRVAVWMWTIEYTKLHPFGGGFDSYRQNEIRYEAVKKVGDESNVEHKSNVVVDAGRAFHSSYFEMLGEQGYPGLILWLMIHAIGFVRMEVLYRRYRKRAEDDGLWIGKLALALQQAHIVTMVGSLFVGIAYQPFVWMMVTMQIGLDSYASRRETLRSFRPMVARAPDQEPAPAN